MYAEVFDEENALDRLEAFASFNGPDFYRLPRNSSSITLTKDTQPIPAAFRLGDSEVVPIRAGDSVVGQRPANGDEDSTHPAGANDSEVVTTATGPTMRDRFRGFLPVVVDIETGGFNCQTDAILEIAMTLLKMSEDGQLEIAETHSRNVEPFEGQTLTLGAGVHRH